MNFPGDHFDVVSQDEFIEIGTAVVVIAIEGNPVMVARKEES